MNAEELALKVAKDMNLRLLQGSVGGWTDAEAAWNAQSESSRKWQLEDTKATVALILEEAAKYIESTPTLSPDLALVERGFAEYHAKRIRDDLISRD
jgi:hypothetical protein